jgi:5-methylcytosine-specific restriction protein B
MTDLSSFTESGDATLLYFDDDYLAAAEVAKLPLESADVAKIAERAREIADARHLLLPEADTLVERCVVALLGGHLILQGPPGTGKTTLAYVLAKAFNATVNLETATADWSTYDVIGGLHPSSSRTGETLVPWLGHVPAAAIECASVIARHADKDENQPHQAHWLIIDEFNRAEIDKAIGPLYTVLGDGSADIPLPLWFGATETTKEVYLPKRFRIIGTMNTVDTNYVYTFSQGLSRRFQFVYVGVPEQSQIADELREARISAAEWYAETYGEESFTIGDFTSDTRIMHATTLLASFLAAVRYDDQANNRPGWPIGTAQILDVYRQLALRRPGAGSAGDALIPAVDMALADRVIPQASNLIKAQLDNAEMWLQAQPLPRTLAELQHLRAASSTGY